MTTDNLSHATNNDVNAHSQINAASPIELDVDYPASGKQAPALAEETLPSPPQHESLDTRPSTNAASEIRAPSSEVQEEGRTIESVSRTRSPVTQLHPAENGAAVDTEAPAAGGLMELDMPVNEVEPSLVQSPNQVESRESIALGDNDRDRQSSQAPLDPTSRESPSQEHRPHEEPSRNNEDVERGMQESAAQGSPIATEAVSCRSEHEQASEPQEITEHKKAKSPAPSDVSKLTSLSDLSKRLAGLEPSTTFARLNGHSDPIPELLPSNGPDTSTFALADSPSIVPSQSIPGSPITSVPVPRVAHKVKPKASIPSDIHVIDYAAQCVAAAEASRLNPYGLELEEHALLRHHITLAQVTTYLNIRNGIVRLWLRKPQIAITKNEAIGCAKDTRFFDLANFCFDWLVRRGYINYGCVEIKEAQKVGRPRRTQPSDVAPSSKPRKRIVIIGAGMSGLGCARQLHNLSKQYRDQFDQLGEQLPEIIVLEGRERVGGRVYSRAFEVQPKTPHPNFPQSRCTAEMGGMIVTGFERGNPMNTLVRGQLGLGYHALLSTTTIYDVDGRPVDIVRDGMVENLFNECLDRVSEYKYKMPALKTVHGNRDNIDGGRDSTSEGYRTLAQAEEAAAARAASSAAARSMPGTPSSQGPRSFEGAAGLESASPRADLVPVSSDRLTGRARLEPGTHAALKAAHKVKAMGWDLKPGVDESRDLDLDPPTQTPGATFGYVVEEAVKQYSELIDLNAQDYRLLNWHVANLEYSNAINHNKLSLLAWDLDAGNEWDGPHSMIVGGYQSVARGLMLCPSPLDVRHKMAVEKITYPLPSADTNESGTDTVVIGCENGESITADYVINTMPLGVLKHGNVEFSPPLPSWKSDAIGRIGFGVLNKIILTFRQPFWDTERDIFGILRQPPNRFSLNQKEYSRCRGRMFQWFNVTKTTGIPCLIALMAGDAAFEQEKTGNEKLVAEATAVLRSVFGADRVPNPIEAVVTRWVSDKFARGSYSSAGPEMKVDDYDVMARPVGKHLHFAGEHTIGTYPATVHGAYLSGVRAASDLIDELLGPIQFPTPLVPAKEGAPSSYNVTSLKRKLAADYDERRTAGDESSSANGSVSGNGSSVNMASSSNTNGTGGSSGHRDAKANSRRRLEAREASILEYIVERIGKRPVRPPKSGDTSYLLFSRANYEVARQKCEEGRRPGKGRAQPNEVRVLTSKMWRSASAEERQPFADQAALLKKKHDEAMQEFLATAADWDQRARDVRVEYEREHPDDRADVGGGASAGVGLGIGLGVGSALETSPTVATTGTTPASSSATPDVLDTLSTDGLMTRKSDPRMTIARLYETPVEDIGDTYTRDDGDVEMSG